MARCFDHGSTVLVQLTSEEANTRQEAEQSLSPEERWRAGLKETVKFWFRKDDATLFKTDLPNTPGWNSPWSVIGYTFLIFRARDIAYERGWLKPNPWCGLRMEQIRAAASGMLEEAKARHEEQGRQQRERWQREEEERQRLQRARQDPERAARALGMGNWHPEMEKKFSLSGVVLGGLRVEYRCGCEEYEKNSSCVSHRCKAHRTS